MKFDDVSIDDLRAAGSLKWSAFPQHLGMFVAEMDFGVAEPIQRVLHRYAHSTGIGYRSTAAKVALQEATAQWLGRATGFHPDPAHIFAVPDVVSSAHFVIDALTDPGSPVILPTPSYMAFCDLIPQMGRELISVPSPVVNGRYTIDLAGIAQAFEAGAQLLILVNPWNPTGRVLEREELAAIADLVSQYPHAYVFSDEIHAPLALDRPHITYSQVSAAAAAHSVTALAASKGWNIPGLKCAQLLATPQVSARLEPGLSWAQNVTSTIGSAAAVAAYTESEEWLADVIDYIRGNRDEVEQAVAQIPGMAMHHIEGTYIAWFDFSEAIEAGLIPNDSQTCIAQWLRDNAGVALTPGAACGCGHRQFARCVLATPRHIVRQAIEQIAHALAPLA
ncbi:MalY/PatB family protein [Trueperella sp. LYQ143]|uniref:MalY/PatB family protein n=1 Tax=Trueperella sp. LYQ143 TaxID=3391059 RepID=UPI003983CC93